MSGYFSIDESTVVLIAANFKITRQVTL